MTRVNELVNIASSYQELATFDVASPWLNLNRLPFFSKCLLYFGVNSETKQNFIPLLKICTVSRELLGVLTVREGFKCAASWFKVSGFIFYRRIPRVTSISRKIRGFFSSMTEDFTSSSVQPSNGVLNNYQERYLSLTIVSINYHIE